MGRPIAPLLGVVTAIAVAAAAAVSAAPRAQAMPSAAATSAADTLTGCLQKGTKSGVYKLVEPGGQTVNIKSSSNLSGHVGHTVKVVTPNSAMNMSGDSTVMSVSKVSMVSASCPGM